MHDWWCRSLSQVGISVSCEDLFSDRQWKVCHAFATFVARRTEAGKVRNVKSNQFRADFLGTPLNQIYEEDLWFGPWVIRVVIHQCNVWVCTGTAQAGDSTHAGRADGVQPRSRAQEDETNPCRDYYRSPQQLLLSDRWAETLLTHFLQVCLFTSKTLKRGHRKWVMNQKLCSD